MSSPVATVGGSKKASNRAAVLATAAVAAAVGCYFLFAKPGGDSAGTQAALPSSDDGDLAGLDEKVRKPQPQTELSAQVQDSFSMIAGAKDLARAPVTADKTAKASVAKGDNSFIDALKNIADKKSPSASAKAPMALPGSRLVAMASGLFGSGGGTASGGGGSSLAAPSSDTLVKVSKPGAGAAPMVPRERDFRAAYGEGSGGASRRAGAAPALQGAFSPFSGGGGSAGQQTGAMPQNAAASAAQGGGAGGTPTSPIAPGTPPPTGDGKGVQNLDSKGKPSDSSSQSPSSSSSNPASSAAQSALGSAASSPFSTKPSGGHGQGSAVQTGVSKYGLEGDIQNGSEFNGALVQASQGLEPGKVPAIPPGWGTADTALQRGAESRRKFAESSRYDPKGVQQLIDTAQNAPAAPTETSTTQLGTGGNIPFNLTNTKLLVDNANQAMAAANVKAGAYRQALQTRAGDVRTMSTEAEGFSKDLQTYKTNVQSKASELEGKVRGDLNTLATAWRQVPPQEPMATTQKEQLALQAKGIIGNYTQGATDLSKTGADIQKRMTTSQSSAVQKQTEIKQALKTARTDLDKAIVDYDKAAAELQKQLAAAGPGVLKEAKGSSGRTLYENGCAISRELNASRGRLSQAQVRYQQADNGLQYSTDLIVDQVYRGKQVTAPGGAPRR